jgi:hypothetical protein
MQWLSCHTFNGITTKKTMLFMVTTMRTSNQKGSRKMSATARLHDVTSQKIYE